MPYNDKLYDRVNLRVPKARRIRQKAKDKGFPSTASYINHLIAKDQKK